MTTEIPGEYRSSGSMAWMCRSSTCSTRASASFPGDTQPNTVPEGDSHARTANMLPVDWESARPSSPIFNYPYSRSRETLAHLHQHGSLHECHGVKMRFINPATGGAPMPTIGAFMQLLPKGFRGTPYRATDSTVNGC